MKIPFAEQADIGTEVLFFHSAPASFPAAGKNKKVSDQ
jgi:hypothetical protein